MTHRIFHRSDDLQSRARLAGYDPANLDTAVLIVGMGALGQNTAQNLALSGVREVRIIDADRFEEHNRTRSPLFPAPGGEGASKVQATAPILQRLGTHPEARVRYAHAWIEDLGLAVFDGVGVVLSCVDTLRGRAYLADACRALSLPLIEAGFRGPDVTVGVFPGATTDQEAADLACWRCDNLVHDQVVSCRVRAEQAEAAGTIPAIQSAAAVLGGLQAEAAIACLHDREPDARRTWLNIRTGESVAAGLDASSGCHGYHLLYPPASAIPASVDAPITEILACAPECLGDRPALRLRSEFVHTAACAACDAQIAVHAPGHQYARNPRCMDCGGPWQPTADACAPNPTSVIRSGDPEAGYAPADVGYAPGDLLLVEGAGHEAVLALRGGPDELLTDADMGRSDLS